MPEEEKRKPICLTNWRQSADEPLKVLCNIDRRLPCCNGVGYRVEKVGALSQAVRCSCVAGCMGCLGQARKIFGDNDSQSCRPIDLNKVIALFNAAEIPARYAEATLRGFSNYTGNGKHVQQRVYELIMSWRKLRDVNSFSTLKGMVISGPVGTGKTYLIASIARALVESGYSVKFVDFFQLLAQLRAGFESGKSDGSQIAPLLKVDLLIIDELGKGRNKEFDLTVLDQLVCGRYNNGKPILATTNYKLLGAPVAKVSYMGEGQKPKEADSNDNEMATGKFTSLEPRVGPRIFSRLADTCVFIELTGDSVRAK